MVFVLRWGVLALVTTLGHGLLSNPSSRFLQLAFPSFASLSCNVREQRKFPRRISKVFVSSASSLDCIVSDPPPIRIEQVPLSSGTVAEVVSCLPEATPGKSRNGKKSPLVFVHGSFHAAWAWSEHYFPFFASRGYPVTALSLRGTGGTYAGDGVTKVKVSEHAEDLGAFLDYVTTGVVDGGLGLTSPKPVLVSHSMGGLAVMKHLERDGDEAAGRLGGIVMMCSVPPSGNGKLTLRYLRRSLVDSWKITAGFAMKKCIKDASLCRSLFFGGDVIRDDNGDVVDDWGVSDEDVARYQGYFERDTVATIDLADLGRNLPSFKTVDGGRAPFLSYLPPCLVVGGADDFIVDTEAVDETATYFGVGKAVMVNSPHDVMLGRNWRNGADAILTWLQESVEGVKESIV